MSRIPTEHSDHPSFYQVMINTLPSDPRSQSTFLPEHQGRSFTEEGLVRLRLLQPAPLRTTVMPRLTMPLISTVAVIPALFAMTSSGSLSSRTRYFSFNPFNINASTCVYGTRRLVLSPSLLGPRGVRSY